MGDRTGAANVRGMLVVSLMAVVLLTQFKTAP